MKVLTLNPPFLPRYTRQSRSPAVSKGGCVYYPIYLGYMTGALMNAGHDCLLYDAPAASKGLEDTLEIVRKFKPELAVVDTSTASIYSDIKVVDRIKEMFPDCFTIVVGSHVTATPHETMQISEHLDGVARAEYDFTIRELAEVLGNGKDLSKVTGLTYRDRKAGNKIVHNPPRKEITGKELDEEFPFVSEVYAKFLNIKDYFYPSVLWPEITIVTGRGCPFRCTFCFIPQVMNGHEYRARSVKNVVDEFEWIKENLPYVKDIMIEDDTFTADRKRIREISQEVIDRGLDITFTSNARADVDLETLKIMKRAGAREVCVGFESGNQQILNNVRKGTTVQGIRKFMKDIKQTGILVHGCFMLGNYGETKETIRETIQFAKEIEPDTAQFFPIMIYPGTEAYRQFTEAGYMTTQNYSEWLTPEGQHNTIISRPGLSNRELVALCDQARKEFYLRPSFIFKKFKQGVMHPREIPRLALSTQVFLKYLLKGTRLPTDHHVQKTGVDACCSAQAQ